MERAIEQRCGEPDFELQIDWRRNRSLAEYTACHVCPQAHIRQQYPGHGQRDVIPFQLKRFFHQPGRHEDANCHSHQQQRAQQREECGRALKIFHRLERVVQRICGPGQLPCAKVGMTVLFVEIGEDKKHQQGYRPGNQHQTCGDAIHWLSVPRLMCPFRPVIAAQLELSLA